MVETIDAQAVLMLAHAQGQTWVDIETARRIAAAATTAVQALASVASGVEAAPLEDSALEFAATLEALGEPQS